MPLVLIIILQQQMTYKYVHVAGLGGWVELLGTGLQLAIIPRLANGYSLYYTATANATTATLAAASIASKLAAGY